MRCTKCGTESTTSRKFCAACGSRLPSRCPKCGAENAPSSAFCEDCGTALAVSAAPAVTSSLQSASTAPEIHVKQEQLDASTIGGERKTVTALFADIKGSMELMEDLDPEEARAVIDPALKLMMDAVHHYGGYVAQSTGDGIFALFGAPIAHEDHPQRAVYAALRMQEALKRYSDRTRAEGCLPIQVRVGVNTGEVVVRSIKTDEARSEYTPVGHSISLAARMQALAPIGSIATTEQVRKLCEGYFAFKALGPTKVKGVSEPVNVCEVTGLGPLRTRLQRSAGRGLTKFVGREREIEALKHAAEQAKAGHGQIVAAMAEPGVGKSRLFYEFKATSQSGWMVLEAFSVSHGKASAYLPVIELLWNYFKISSDDDERTRREKITGRVLALDRSLEDALPNLYALLGLSDENNSLGEIEPQMGKRRALEAIKRILLRESLNQPLIVIFEDLHWIDDESQAFLNLFADSIGTAKILLLVNYRPEYSHQWNSKTYYTQLRLDPLGKESAEEMLAALIGDEGNLVPIKRLVIEKTEGNPFYMEEMVQALFEGGTLVRNGAVKLTRSLSQLKIPPTVQAILAARIDRLPPAEKELLQTLAVIGKEFPLNLLREVAGAGELERRLEHLQLAEFIYEQPAVGDVEYTFKHALTLEVAYSSLLVERRRSLHQRVAEAVESLHADRLDDHYPELARHF
jgi:class 3 adenylate cyclase